MNYDDKGILGEKLALLLGVSRGTPQRAGRLTYTEINTGKSPKNPS